MNYNYNYFPYQYPPMYTPPPQQTPNILPSQQVLQAAGKASIDALQMAPNSSVLIMDTTAPIVWLCTSDGLGKVTSTAYDITTHKEPQPIDSLEERVTRLEAILSGLGEKNEQSDDASAKSRKNTKSAGEYTAGKADVEQSAKSTGYVE